MAVADLDAAAHELEARHGLASIEGGRHAGWGTANRIVPLRESYIELITVVDEAEDRLGLAVSEGSRTGRDGRLLRWRLAGVEKAAADPSLPFFVEWGEG